MLGVIPRRMIVPLFLVFTALTGRAEDWPQFRGPAGQGHSSERGLPLEWSDSRNVMWKAPIAGLGWSSPAVAGGRVWLTTAMEKQFPISLRAIAFDAATGREVVNVEVFTVEPDPLLNAKNSYASPTPIIEGERVYVHFGPYGTAALTAAGEIVWKVRLPHDPEHGNGGSPVLHGDLLIVNCDGIDEAYIVALDKKTGETRWKSPRRKPAGHAYSTPLVIRAGNQDQVVSVGAFRVTAYEPQTGKEIWRVEYTEGYSNVPRPVYGNGLVFITTGLQHPSLMAIRPDGKDDVTRTHLAWKLERAVPVTPSPLLVGDELYLVSDLGVATCVDARTGRVHWQERLGGNFSASPIFADGRIYFMNELGATTVLAPGKAFRRLATNSLKDAWTLGSMAVSGGSIFIRSSDYLYRIGGR
jgi:outer membrane protein assembly factor BamB